jgi:hypothetical protein
LFLDGILLLLFHHGFFNCKLCGHFLFLFFLLSLFNRDVFSLLLELGISYGSKLVQLEGFLLNAFCSGLNCFHTFVDYLWSLVDHFSNFGLSLSIKFGLCFGLQLCFCLSFLMGLEFCLYSLLSFNFNLNFVFSFKLLLSLCFYLLLEICFNLHTLVCSWRTVFGFRS